MKIVTVPSPGSLTLGGTPVTANQNVTKADIDAARLVFAPDTGGSGSPYTTFDFKVSDGTAESASDYTMTVNVRANAVATGEPAIAGTAQVGMDLTASAGTIADADGLTGVIYSYQWIQVDGGSETDITGAMSATYTLLPADLGKTLKVRASFTDDAGFAESLTSAATAEVTAASVATGIADASGVEGAAITFTVTLAAAAAQELTVDYATSVAAADTAAQTDFTAGSGTLTFAAGDTQKTFTVSTRQDRIDESAETFTVTLSGVSPAGAATLPDPAATGTINDDDDAPMLVLTVAPASIAEAGGTSSAVTVSTGSGSTFPDAQTITLALSGTATETDDYTINSKSLTLSAGVDSAETAVTATVTAVDDTLSEGGETVLIDATRAPGNLAVGTRQTLTIIDDDRRATGAPAIAGTLQVGMDLTASAGTIADADGLTRAIYSYQWIQVEGGTETDISGAMSATYTLLPADLGKTLKVRASFIDNAGFDESRTSAETATVTAGSVATGIADASGAEGAAITFTVTLAAAAAQDVTVNYATSVAAADTAAQTDFTAGSATLTFVAGETQKTFTVSTLQDRIDESAETFTVTLSGVSPAGAATLPDPTATGTINDDDAAPVLVLSVVPASIAEAGGTSTVTVSTGPGSSTFPDDRTITLALSGTATETDDYTINSTSLTLPAGVGSVASSVTATVTAVDDDYDDDAETVIITASRGANTIGSETITITDDDAAPMLVLSVAPASIAEDGGTSTVTVSTGSGSTFPDDQTITLALLGTATETDDYTINSTSLTLSAGVGTAASSVTATVTGVEDNYDDDAETIIITASRGSNTIGSETITITDDDGPPVLVLSVAPASIAEDGGTSTVTVSTGSGSTFPDDQTITLALLGTATETDDYTINSKSLTLSAGVGTAASSVTATVTGVNDVLSEGDETVLIDATRGTGNLAVGTRQTLTIIDDDRHATGAPAIAGTPQVGMDLTASAGTIADADGLTNVSYNYQWIRVDGGTETDISGATGSTYTLVPADVGKTLKVRASFTDDAGFAESRTSDATATVIAAASTSCPAPSIGTRRNIWVSTLTVGERRFGLDVGSHGFLSSPSVGALTSRTFNTGLNGYTVGGVTVGRLGGTAGNLSFITTRELTATEKAALRLHVCGDSYSFSDASRLGSGTSSSYIWNTSLNWSTVSTRTLYLSLPANNMATGAPVISGTAEIGQDLSAGISGIADLDGLPSSFTYQWSRVDADGTSNETSITSAIAATYTLTRDDGGKKVKVQVSFTDNLGNKEKLTSAAYPSTGTVPGPPNTAATGAPAITGTPQVGMMLTASAGTIADADGLSSVSYSYQWIQVAGGTETDISGKTGSTYTPVPADVGKTLKVRASFTDDDNNNEALTSAETAGVTAAPAVATGIADASGVEGAAITFTVTLAAAAAQELTVNYATSVETGDTAAQTDFTAGSGPLTFMVGDTQKTFTVSTRQDRIDESAETFTVTLSGVSPAGAATLPADPTATGTINDDDAAPMLVLTVAPASIAEAGGTSSAVTVSTGSGSTFSDAQTITLALSGTATETDDYTLNSTSLTLPAGVDSAETSVTATVTAVDDNYDDDAETIIITASRGATPSAPRPSPSPTTTPRRCWC